MKRTMPVGPFGHPWSNLNLDYVSGLINCLAAMNGHEQKLMAFLTYRQVPNQIPSPYITNQVDSGYNVIGGSLSLICKVNVDYNTAHIELQWGFPHKVDLEKVSIWHYFKSAKK